MKTYMNTAFFFLLSLSLHAQQVWTKVYDHPTSTFLMSIDFPTPQTGYVLGGMYLDIGIPANGFVLKTTNGGTNWNVVADSTNYQLSLYGRADIIFKNSQNGAIISSGSAEANIDNAIYTTTDGGNSWIHNNIVGLRKINDVELVNGILYLYGEGLDAQGNKEGRLYTSADMGLNWSLIYQGENFSQIYFLDNNIGYAQYPSTKMYKTTDGGYSWNQISSIQNPNGTVAEMSTLYFVDDQIGVSGGWYSPMFMRTTDGGYTWEEPTIANENNLILFNISAHNGSDAIYAHTSTGPTPFLYRSLDKGDTWTKIVPNHNVGALHLFDEFQGVGISEEGEIYLMDTSSLLVNDSKIEKKIKVYPNPAKNTLNIEIVEQTSIQKICLTDMQGKMIREYAGNLKKLDVSNVAAGNYLLQVFTGQGKITKKVMVE